MSNCSFEFLGSLFISSFLLNLSFFFFMNQINEAKVKIIKSMSLSFLMSFIFVAINIFSNAFFKALISFSIFTLVIHLFYSVSKINALIKSIFWLIFLSLVDSLNGVIFILFLKTNVNNILEQPILYLIYNSFLVVLIISSSMLIIFTKNRLSYFPKILVNKNHHFFILYFCFLWLSV